MADRCEGCEAPATGRDADGVPLCHECGAECETAPSRSELTAELLAEIIETPSVVMLIDEDVIAEIARQALASPGWREKASQVPGLSATLDDARAQLAERDRYIAEQRAITESSVQDLARQLREARADLENEREARGIVDRELREARRERDEARDCDRNGDAKCGVCQICRAEAMELQRIRKVLATARAENAEAQLAAMTERAELAEATVARMQHLHRTKPGEALDRATIRSVAEDDGLVHSADVLRLLTDVEKAERDLAEAGKLEDRLIDALGRVATMAQTRIADAERRIAHAQRERDAMCALHVDTEADLRMRIAELEHEANRLRDTYRALRRTMHRRAQRAESATAAARREAIGQRRRADWWRGKAKQVEVERAQEHAAIVRDAKHHGPLDAERAARLRHAVGLLTERASEAEERARARKPRRLDTDRNGGASG